MSFDWCCRCGRPDPPEGCTRPEDCHPNGEFATEWPLTIPAGIVYTTKPYPGPDYSGTPNISGDYTLSAGGGYRQDDFALGIIYQPPLDPIYCYWDFSIRAGPQCDFWNRCWYDVQLWFSKVDYPGGGVVPLGTRWQWAWYSAGPFYPSELTFPVTLDFYMGSDWHGYVPCVWPTGIYPVLTWPSSVSLGPQP